MKIFLRNSLYNFYNILYKYFIHLKSSTRYFLLTLWISLPLIPPQDERFNGEIDSITGYRTKALLCMPIKDSSGDVIGVAQVINKLNGECFTEADEKVSKQAAH